MLVVVTLVRSRFESLLDSTQLTNLKRERVVNVPNLYGDFCFLFWKLRIFRLSINGFSGLWIGHGMAPYWPVAVQSWVVGPHWTRRSKRNSRSFQGTDATVRIWHCMPREAVEMAKLEVQSCAGVKAVAWAPDGLKLATGGVGELGCFSLDHGMWSSQKF